MRYILFSIFIAFPILAFGQLVKTGITTSGEQEIDSGTIRIYYKFNMLDSTRMRHDKTGYDIQRLEIGNRYSKYYSYAIFHNDSLLRVWHKKNPSVQSVPMWITPLTPSDPLWTEYSRTVYLKDFSKNLLTEYTQMPEAFPDYQYTENVPVQDWALHSDTLTIVGYLCQKAVCRFRGRDFTAWFAPEIPVSNGPWKFGGLPGLILKVYDKDNLYTFECAKIENQPYKIYLADYSRYGKTDRDKLLKLQRDLHEDYIKMSGIIITGGTPPLKPTTPYQPLELE